MKVTLIRHTSVAVPKGTCYGWSDVDVADTFEEEAIGTLRLIEGCHFDHAFTSPLLRARKLAARCGYPDATPDDRLKEMSFGVKEGSRLSPEEAAVFRADPRRLERFAGGETAVEVCRRTQEFLLELAKRDDGGRYLVFPR